MAPNNKIMQRGAINKLNCLFIIVFVCLSCRRERRRSRGGSAGHERRCRNNVANICAFLRIEIARKPYAAAMRRENIKNRHRGPGYLGGPLFVSLGVSAFTHHFIIMYAAAKSRNLAVRRVFKQFRGA